MSKGQTAVVNCCRTQKYVACLLWGKQQHPVILRKTLNCTIKLYQFHINTYIWLRPRLTLTMTWPFMSSSGSLYLTARERRAMAGQMLSLLRYMVMTVILIAVDFMVFWVFELVHHQAQGEIVTQGIQDKNHSMVSMHVFVELD